jgi:hypothetical protein
MDAGQIGVQIGRDLRQGRVDHGDVEHQHRGGQADDGERA